MIAAWLADRALAALPAYAKQQAAQDRGSDPRPHWDVYVLGLIDLQV
jgi:hypothetical protein